MIKMHVDCKFKSNYCHQNFQTAILSPKLFIFQLFFTEEIFRFDGRKFEFQVDANYYHAYTKLASYNGSPFVTGGSDGVTTEIFDLNAGKWNVVEDYPFADTL